MISGLQKLVKGEAVLEPSLILCTIRVMLVSPKSKVLGPWSPKNLTDLTDVSGDKRIYHRHVKFGAEYRVIATFAYSSSPTTETIGF